MLDLHVHAHAAVVAIVALGVCAAPAAAKKPRAAQKAPPVFSDAGFEHLSAAQQLAALADQTVGGHLAVINSRRYIRYPDGTLVRI